MQKSYIFFLSFFIFKVNLSTAQQFQNMDLDGVVGVSNLPYNWQGVPNTDPACKATHPLKATADMCDLTGPTPSAGVLGKPYTGTTYVSGLYGFDNNGNIFHEGIMQTVDNFTIGCSYSIKFHQAVDTQDPSNFKDGSGFWRVYVDNTLAGSTAVTTSNIAYNNTSLAWQARTVNFTATATSHTIKFLPMDNDANSNYDDYYADGGVRMAIDSIYLVPNGAGSITQNVSICPGDSYTLPDGQEVFTAGTYTTTIPPSGTVCGTTITTILTVKSGVILTKNVSICFGTTYILPGGKSVDSAGTYIDTIDVSGSCDSIITTIITINPAPNASQHVSICLGNSYTLPDGNVVTTAGTYQQTIHKPSGCDSIFTTYLTINPVPTGSANVNICAGKAYTLPSGEIVTAAGSYNDTIPITSGCDSIFTTHLTVTPAPTSNKNASICSGSNYILPSGKPVNVAGTYVDTIATSGGCDSVITVTLTVSPFITMINNFSICQGTIYTLPTGNTATTAGIYTDTLHAAGGCDSIVITNLAVNSQPTATVSANVTIQKGASTNILASGGVTYSWLPSIGLSCSNCNNPTAVPSQTTTYCLSVTNASGCSNKKCVTVEVIETPCITPTDLTTPNAFSPNADGVNDEFCLQGWNSCLENFIVTIYNRWGEKVFESKDPSFCWNGSNNGIPMDAAVFVYYIKAKYIGVEEPLKKKGNISLIK